MNFMTFHILGISIGNFIIPTDFNSIIFQRVEITNQIFQRKDMERSSMKKELFIATFD